MDPEIPTLDADQLRKAFQSKGNITIEPTSKVPTPEQPQGDVPVYTKETLDAAFKAVKAAPKKEVPDEGKIWEQNKHMAGPQFTSPHIHHHAKNYAGEAIVNDADEVHIKGDDGSWTPTDKNKHVVLTDPKDGKLKVYNRTKDTDYGPVMGRLIGISQELAPGLATGPIQTGAKGVMEAGRGLRVLGFGSKNTPEAGTTGRNVGAGLNPNLEKSVLDIAETRGSQIAQAANRVEQATGENIPVPKAVASDSPTIQRGAEFLSHMPFSGGPLRQGAEAMGEGVARAANAASEIPSGVAVTPRSAGQTVAEGIENYAHRDPDVGYLQGNVKKLFEDVKNAFTKRNTQHQLGDTQKVVDTITKPYTQTGTKIPQEIQDLVDGPLSKTKGLSYDNVHFVLRRLGEMIGDPSKLPAGTSVSELKRVYEGVKSDLRDLVEVAGGKRAISKLDRAFEYTRKAAERRQELHKFLGTSSEEGIFAKVADLAGQTRKADLDMLRKVRKSMNSDEWDDVSSAILGRMGKAMGGQGEFFDPSKYVKDWERMAPEARNILVPNARTRQAVEDIVQISKRWGDAKGMSHAGGGFHAAADLITASSIASPILFHAIQSGDMKHVMTAAVALFGTNFISRVMASPVTAASAAKWAHRYNTFAVSPSSGTLQALNNATQTLKTHITDKPDTK